MSGFGQGGSRGTAKPPVYLHFSPSEAIDESDLLRHAAARARQKTIDDDVARARARQHAWACKLEYEEAWSDVFGPSLSQQGYPKDYMGHSVYHHLEGSKCGGHVTADGTIGGCALGIPDFFDSHKLPEAADQLSRLPRPARVRPAEQQTAQHTAQQTEQQTEQKTVQKNSQGHQQIQLSVSDLPVSMRRGLPVAVANALEPFQKDAQKKSSARDLLAQLADSQNSGSRSPRPQKASPEASSTQGAESHGTGSRSTGFAAMQLNPSHPEFVPQSHVRTYPDFSRPVHSHVYDVQASHEPTRSGAHAGHSRNGTGYAAAESPSSLMIHGPVPQRPYPIIQMHQFDVEGRAEAPLLPQLPYGMEPLPPPSPPQTVQCSPHPSSTQASNFWLNRATHMQQLAPKSYHTAQQEHMTPTQQAMVQSSDHQNIWTQHHRRQENIAAAQISHTIGAADREALATSMNASPSQIKASDVGNTQSQLTPNDSLYFHTRGPYS